MRHSLAYEIAQDIIRWIEPTCEPGFCVVGGSVRRGKPDVHDIEIVAKPILRAPRPEFGAKVIHKTLLDQVLFDLAADGYLTRVKGGEKLQQYKINLAAFGLDNGGEPFCVEFWLCTPPSEWGVHYTIRTGPSDFSKWMVTERRSGGALPDGYICQDNVIGRRVVANGITTPGKYFRDGMIAMPTEQDFFEFCGLKYLEPSKRVARWGRV